MHVDVDCVRLKAGTEYIIALSFLFSPHSHTLLPQNHVANKLCAWSLTTFAYAHAANQLHAQLG